MATTKSVVHQQIHTTRSIELDQFDSDNSRESNASLSDSVKDQVIRQKKQDGLEALSSTSPALPTSTLQKWNEPRGNIPRFIACFFTFFVMGLGDAAYGALLPYVSKSHLFFPRTYSNDKHLVQMGAHLVFASSSNDTTNLAIQSSP